MKTQSPDLRPRDRPYQAHVERDPRELLGQHGLGALVQARALGPEGDLAGADQHVIEPGVSIEGEVQRLWSPAGAFARRQWIEEEMRITARDGGLGESDVVLARTTRRPEGGIGFETYAHRMSAACRLVLSASARALT